MKSKQEKIRHFDEIAPQRRAWREKSAYYYRQMESLLSFLIPQGCSLLEIGCGTGETLKALNPQRGLGIDFSAGMIEQARQLTNDNLEFRIGDAELLDVEEIFDYIVLTGLIGELTDVWTVFRNLRKVSDDRSKIVVTYFNTFWEPVLKLGMRYGLKMPQDHQNWLSVDDIENLLGLNGFEVIRKGNRLLIPWNIPFISEFVNRYLAQFPLIRKLCLVTYVVAQRKAECITRQDTSVTVLVPCRNEKGNIRPIINRIPRMGVDTEILFVDGNSNDGTVAEVESLIQEFDGTKNIRLLHQLSPDSQEGLEHGKMLKLGKGTRLERVLPRQKEKF